MSNLVWITIALGVAIAIYRFHRQILDALRRFDQRNVARQKQEFTDRHDQLAHFRHTLKLAEEQVEGILEVSVSDPLIGTTANRFVFEGEEFLNRRDAERAREDQIRAKARAFYVELPAALVHRGKERLH